MVGLVPEEIRKNAIQGPPGTPVFKSFPKEFAIEMKIQDGNLKFQADATLDKAEDAKEFVASADALVKKGLDELKNPPPFPPNVPNVDKLMKGATDLLKSIKLEAKGKELSGSMTISQDLINAYLGMGMAFIGEVEGGAALCRPRPRRQ